MHQTWSQRERERGNGEQSSRGVGRVGTMAAVNSREKNRLEKRSSRRAWCTFGRHFLSSASARCAVAHVRLRWRRRRRLVAVGENFLFSSLAWQLGRRKGVCLQDELQTVPVEIKKKEERPADGRSSGPSASASSSSDREPVKKAQKAGAHRAGQRDWDFHSLRQQKRTRAESEKWRSHNNEVQKGETSSLAPALRVLRGRGRSITSSGIVSHFDGVTCVLLAGGCSQTARAAKHSCRNQPSVRPPCKLEFTKHQSFDSTQFKTYSVTFHWQSTIPKLSVPPSLLW